MRCAVAKSNSMRRHALECLRLAMDCKQLAAELPNPAMQEHYLRMAEEWALRADGRPDMAVTDAAPVYLHFR